jgi:hypothetical protein
VIRTYWRRSLRIIPVLATFKPIFVVVIDSIFKVNSFSVDFGVMSLLLSLLLSLLWLFSL